MIGFALAAALASTCLPVTSDRISVRDLLPTMRAFASAPQDTAVSFAPQPGVARVFPPAELQQIATRYGVQFDAAKSVCFEWPMQPFDLEAARTAMLRRAGAEAPDLEVLEGGPKSIPAGELTFGGRPNEAGLWRGYVEYAPGRRFSVWARVNLHVSYSRVVAARALRAGECLDEAAVHVEAAHQWAGSEVSVRVEEIPGKCLKRSIAEGSVIPASALASPPAVNRGDVLRVEVRAGAARIAFDGTAEGAAAAGQFVAIRNPETKRIVRARVVESGQAVLDLDSQEAR